ncbi:GntR family transcriptional regulator [Microbulbifer sp. SAOS-129_SWC]|uniref:GntR family transcriptional regulator n=1 Tax=Microbulbifer sp. SAOS-129_SWC TaxID=3145235 RepID=UPI0032167E04
MSVYDRIKTDLVAGHLAAGSALTQTELAERYGVSRIPVRDALQRLKSEGWLAPHGKRGVAVPRFDALEVEDLYLMRTRLEPLLLQFAAGRLSGETLGRARDILDRMEREADLPAEAIGELNWQFHACLYQAAKHPTLFAAVEQLNRQYQRYIGYQARSLDYQHTSQREHYAMLEALRRGEGDAAAALLEQHIATAGRTLVAYLRG